MKLYQIQLENYRCFESLDLELDSAMTVLAGENASGKTALLEALALSLATFFRVLPQAPQGPGRIQPAAARVERIQTNGEAERYPHFPVKITCRGTLQGAEHSWARELRSVRTNTTAQAESLFAAIEAVGQEVIKGQAAHLPLVAYFGTQRLWLQKKKKAEPKRKLPNRFAGYLDCLDPASNHKHWRDWMFHQTMVELQDRTVSPLLAAVQSAVCAAIPGAERFFFDAKNEELRIVWSGSRRAQPFDELSDGYRNMVGVVADIAWRAAVLNPADGKAAPQKATGVVLIDEVDLHLHPRWLRDVLAALRRAFPNLQFVVTTHSPQVLGTCQPEWVRLLDGTSQVRHVGKIFGWDSNDVLAHIMKAPIRDRAILQPLQELDRAIEEQRWQDAEAKVTQLAEVLGEDHSDIVRARWSLHLERGDADAQPEEEP